MKEIILAILPDIVKEPIEKLISFIGAQMRQHPRITALIVALLVVTVALSRVIWVRLHPLIYIDTQVSIAYSGKQRDILLDRPESLEMANWGTLYLTDNDRLLALRGHGEVENIPLLNEYEEDETPLAAKIVHVFGNDLFVLTQSQDADKKYGLLRITVQNGEIPNRAARRMICTFPRGAEITDFAVSKRTGNIWFIEHALETVSSDDGTNTQKRRFRLRRFFYDADDNGYDNYRLDSDVMWPLQEEVSQENNPKLAFDMDSKNLYVSLPDDSMILIYSPGTQDELSRDYSIFAGDSLEEPDSGSEQENPNSAPRKKERRGIPGFRDRTKNAFFLPVNTALYRPTSIVADGEYLYALDYNTVRRFSLKTGNGETLAGSGKPSKGSAYAQPERIGETIPGKEAVFPSDDLTISRATITLNNDGNVFLSDPTNNAIYKIVIPKS